MTDRWGVKVWLAAAMCVMGAFRAWAQTPEPASPEPDQGPPVFRVTIVEATPLPGLDLPPAALAMPIQTTTAVDILKSASLDISSFMNRQMASISVAETQGNPFQPDLSFRGYTASPLLGAPQGLSVYVDGVRVNQPFGEVVSWDLIPRVAIQSATFMPGSNPLFGLNTLGGALSVHTKDGSSNPGTVVQGLFGADARRAVEFEHGGSRPTGLNWYLAGNLFAEDGWREDSPSDVRQVFGKVGWRDANTSISMSASHANNSLTGNGMQEFRLLDADRRSIFTKPDETNNRSTLLNLSAVRTAGPSRTWSGNAYFRHIKTSTLNGDINEESLDQAVYQPNAAERNALSAAGYTGVPTMGESAANTPFPSWRCIANVLLNDEPSEKCNGLLNRSSGAQRTAGAALQLTVSREAGSMRNLLTIGGGFDASRVDFAQSTELGYLNPDRSVTGLNAFGDGVTGGDADGEPFDTRVHLKGTVRTASAYVSNSLSLKNRLHLSFSGRLNRTAIVNRDQINPGGDTGSLDGEHAYVRVNPAAGMTFTPSPTVNLYAGYSEGSRAPASIELGCADPEAPCKLPNAMAGDPPLEQVVTRTLEAGLRSHGENTIDWNVGVFRAANSDDILFVASEQTGFGYFRNFGSTRRQGLEAGARVVLGKAAFGVNYTLLSATFRSGELVNGTGNSTNEEAEEGIPGGEGSIEIEAGDEIPGVPRHLAKFFADIQATARLGVSVGVVASGGSYARGNENNDHEPDGIYYLGEGRTDAYAVASLSARYRVSRLVELVGEVANLFDAAYNTVAQLGPTGIRPDGSFVARPFPSIQGEFPVTQSTFFAPGAPRRASLALRFTF
jgi:outer membrane receptor protein involved in Fe transport